MSRFTLWCKHHHCPPTLLSSHTGTLHPLQRLMLPNPQPLAPTLPAYACDCSRHFKEVQSHSVSPLGHDGLISLSIKSSRSIHVVACVTISLLLFLFKADLYSIVCLYTCVSFQLWMGTCCFHLLVIETMPLWARVCKYLFKALLWLPWGFINFYMFNIDQSYQHKHQINFVS